MAGMWHSPELATKPGLALRAVAAALLASVATVGAQGAGGALFPGRLPREARSQELVPAGRWLHDGGGLGRNAASANAALLRRPQFAWRQALTGKLHGEPRVWDDHIVLALLADANQQRIEVRRLSDGSLVGTREQNSGAAPDLAVWGNEIIWRSSAGQLELLRFDDFDVRYVRSMPKASSVSAPLRAGRNVYAIVDQHLVCMRASDFRVKWRSPSTCAGTLSLLDHQVYALQKMGAKHYAVVAHDEATGKLRARSRKFALREPPSDAMHMQLAGRTLLVRFGDEHALAEFQTKGIKLNALQFSLPLHAAHPGAPESMTCVHAMDPNVHVSPMHTGRGPHLAMFPTDKDEGLRLDSCDLHRELGQVPATIARGVMYFGACAVETQQLRMLWRMTAAEGKPLPKSRAIPAGTSLLLFADGELVALRQSSPPNAVANELQAALRVAERDVLEPLVGDAMAANDWELARDLLARCRELRADERWATMREQDLDRGESQGRGRVRAQKARVVQRAAAVSLRTALQAVQEQVSAWAVDRSPVEHRLGLRFVLERDSHNPAAVAAVRDMLSGQDKKIQVAKPFAAMDWLDYLAATSHTPVEWLAADATAGNYQRQLAEWQEKWRSDLRALKSDRLVLFSPITQPGSLAKALATGELVCSVLESMFGHMPKRRDDLREMLVFIYPDRQDYLRESAKIGASVAGMAGGYYSWHEKPPKSRLFVPGDAAGFASVLPTLAHELTHQWLMDRCAAFRPDASAALAGPKAFWIVEGFASLVEQFEFDVERHQVRFGKGGDLHRADLVASIPKGKHLKWDWLVGAKRSQFMRLANSKEQLDVGSRTRLGRRYRVRAVDLFYAQSAMLTRYLYEAEDGKHRQRLLDFVVNYYTGELDELDFEQAFGMTAQQFGDNVIAFSQRLVE